MVVILLNYKRTVDKNKFHIRIKIVRKIIEQNEKRVIIVMTALKNEKPVNS